ncbi:MAG: prepilin-type N-terminal cleavage/methylation domain-containing protein [Pirellulaceae bacterium]
MPAYHRRTPRGFTLLELLLVLALLVMIAALVIPALQLTLQDQRLRKAGDLLRSQMGKARVRSMKTGRMHALWIEPGGNRYRIEPWITGDEALEGNQSAQDAGGQGMGAQGVGGLAGGGAAMSDPNLMMTEEVLPEGVVFYASESAQDNRTLLALQQGTSASGATQASPSAPPILFYPDGTTSTARLVVTDGEGSFVLVAIRGLTGIAQVSDPLSQQEMMTP